MRHKLAFVLSLAALIVLLAATAASAATETAHLDQTFPAAAGGTVRVDVGFHDVEVTVAPGTTVHVVADTRVSTSPAKAKRLVERVAPTVVAEGSDIRVASHSGGTLVIGFLKEEGKVAITMPPEMALDLETGSGDVRVAGDLAGQRAVLHTGSGDVAVHGAADSLAVRSGSGDVVLDLERPVDRVSVRTSSGDVRLDGGTTHAEVATSSGDVHARDLTGGAMLSSSSGDIVATWTALAVAARVEVHTSSGDVTLAMPAGAVLAGEIRTGSGGIASTFPGAVDRHGHDLQLAGGSGAALLDVRTGSGDVSLREAE